MNIHTLQDQLLNTLRKLLRARVILFLLLVAVVYGFLILRINTLKNAQPSTGAAVSQINSSTNIDQATIDKITLLQDNSVSVQALFNQARQNPFHE
ncbi:MAG TPA: hypothetical protein VNG32_01100 [Candidatus Dormibacteraeota bacterium]|nr:hypothetical protein [Candidatus Dormibacteraeota bacterium]